MKRLQSSLVVKESTFVAIYLFNALDVSVIRQTVLEGAFILR